MPDYDWTPFLNRWGGELAVSERANPWNLMPELIEAGWPYRPNANEVEIDAAEARLGLHLPPSYRDFLKVSNGWPVMGNPFSGGLRPVAEIERFAVRNQAWLDVIRRMPDDPSAEFAYPVGAETFEAAIEISHAGEGILLLNPAVVDANGEMEAWLFEAEMGIKRYRSFWGMMQTEYEIFCYLEASHL